MIITIIFVIMLVLGIIFECKGGYDLNVIGILLTAFGSVLLLISLIAIIVSHATANKTIQQNKINYDGLCKRYEVIKSEYEDVSKSDVIADDPNTLLPFLQARETCVEIIQQKIYELKEAESEEV